MFGAETASRFLERWNGGFKDKVLREARDLRETPLLKNQLKSALNEASDTDEPGTFIQSYSISVVIWS